MIFVDLVLLPDLPAVKHHKGCRRNGAKGCRLNVVGAMWEGRISERSEGGNYQRPFPIDSAK